ncbi:hypothetical protein [Hespellia stercorisuis]|uniref:hypothetical protein n=1 Tax=Hespellia stercorisuis TaxID=180311 RepID=UPI001FA86142|nr:hypothetical protein [Hespellia stercorisuis]
MAKYTFTEQCEEVKDLHLEDGTKKIFLNMTSKNGSKDLISLLQYMKETDIDNPEIIVKDERIVELDQIVREVKESEEWEAVKMNILEVGVKRGLEQGLERGLEQGEELFASLTERLISDDRVEDLKQAAKDKKLRSKLYQEYGLVKTKKK